MGFYDERILPHLIDRVCSMGDVMAQRAQVVPLCHGEVLEVGTGSGINLPLYDPARVSKVYALEPSQGMRRKARHNLAIAPVPVEWLDLPGERIPLADNSVDTILLTFTLCTIPDWRAALAQMHRVLRPDGQLHFLEHGLCAEPGVEKWQHRLTPAWKKVAGGCHLDRPIAQLLEQAGFVISQLDNLYLDKAPRIAGYLYRGSARK